MLIDKIYVAEWFHAKSPSLARCKEGDLPLLSFSNLTCMMCACVCHTLLCGYDSDYSFCPITFKLHMWVVDDERRNPLDLGSQGQSWRSTLALCVSDIVHTIQTTVFAQSFSNFSCKLWMMRGGTLLIFGQGVEGQGQLRHYVLDLVDTIQTTVFAQSLSNFTCKLSMMRGGTLLIMGHGIKDKGQLWHSVYITLWS